VLEKGGGIGQQAAKSIAMLRHADGGYQGKSTPKARPGGFGTPFSYKMLPAGVNE